MRRIFILFAALISSAWLWAQTPTAKTFSTIATMTTVDGNTWFVTLDGTPKVWKKFQGNTLRAFLHTNVTSITNATGLTGISGPYEGDLAINTAKDTLWIRGESGWIVFKAGTSGSTPTLQNVLVAGNSANSSRITNLGTPISGTDATTKNYVDTQVSSGVDAAGVYAAAVADLARDSAYARSIRTLRDSLARTGWVTSADLQNTAVTPGTYTNATVTFDADGRATSAANGSGGGSSTKFQFSATAPTDTARIWVDTILGRKHFWPAKRYNKGAWRQTEWYDFLSGYFGTEKPLTIIATGQSNMQSACSGSGSDISTHPYLYRWDSGTSTWITTAFSVTNPGLAFAKEFIAKRNAPIRIFHYAVGGTAIAQWQSGGSMYNTLIAYVNAADTVDVDAVIWHQGEADSGLSSDAYYTAFYQVVNGFRALSWFGQKKPWVVGGLYGQNVAQDRTLRRIGLDGDGYTGYANSEGLSSADALHFRCAAIDSLGKRYYNVFTQMPYIVAQSNSVINDIGRLNTHFNINNIAGNFTKPYLPGTGSDNFFWGLNAGQNITSATGNFIMGREAGTDITSGNYNYLIGRGAGKTISTGSNNIVIGDLNGYSNSMGSSSGNVLLRGPATAGNNNVNIIGSSTSGSNGTVIIGNSAGQANIAYQAGVLIGENAGANINASDFPIAIGKNAGASTNSVGTRMIAIGTQSLYNATVRSNIIAIGDLALQGNSLSNVIGLGNSAAADRANQLTIGSSVTSILLNGRLYATGSGTPEGAVTANVGSIFQRTDGGINTTFYIKQSGTGNTGWSPAYTTGSVLILPAGTATASTAPLKFTSGTNLTTAEAGAVEYDGTEFYGTTSTASRTIFARVLKGSTTLDFGSTAAGAVTDLTITVTGAADGDVVSLSVPNASQTTTGSFSAWVSATNTVTVRYRIAALTGSEDPASGVFKVTVTK